MLLPHLEGLEPCSDADLAMAAEGARRERRESTRRRRLHATEVSQEDETLWSVTVRDLEGPPNDFLEAELHWAEIDLFDEYTLAVVLEVNLPERTFFVKVRRGRPRNGEVTLRPVDFMEPLSNVYDSAARGDALSPLLRRALAGALGARAPAVECGGTALERLWAQPWSSLWGPPGTGKTTTVAKLLAEHSMRGAGPILFVSTTNQATDTAALRFGDAVRALGGPADRGVRVGPRSEFRRYEREELLALLPAGEQEQRAEIAARMRARDATGSAPERARLAMEIKEMGRVLGSAPRHFAPASGHVVFATTHSAVRQLDPALKEGTIRELVARGTPPFESVVIDEAGLISRAVVAALALLASKRVVIVGDPRQLSPISRAHRLAPTSAERFFARSALEGLELPDQAGPTDARLHFLETQYRSNAHIGELVSRYQYEGRVRTAPSASGRLPTSPGLPAAGLYVLDEDREARGQPSKARGRRVARERGWVRELSVGVMRRLFAAYPELERGPGLLIAPFVAQVRAFERLIDRENLREWSATSVHRQQGGEADYVVFDTVHAGSTGFSEAEWRRLLNVGLSRARRCVLLLANTEELAQPFLRPLAELMQPVVLRGGALVEARLPARAPEPIRYGAARGVSRAAGIADGGAPDRARPPGPAVPPSSEARSWTVGGQLARRARLRRIFGEEQERIRRMRIDEGPRLVRGVAGSGKTIIAAHWALSDLASLEPDAKLLFAVGNRALEALVTRSLEEAARSGGHRWPDPRLVLAHAGDTLRKALAEAPETGEVPPGADLEAVAARASDASLEPRFDVLYVDEAQDLGEAALRALFRLVRPVAPAGSGGDRTKPVRIFYDDAQQLYDRGRPHWAQLGIDLRGRSLVLRESHRSTTQIGELALNTLLRLERSLGSGLRELVDDQLVDEVVHEGRTVLRSLHHVFDGPAPTVRMFEHHHAEVAFVAEQIERLVRDQDVPPERIKIIRMNLGGGREERLVAAVRDALDGLYEVRVVKRGFAPSADAQAIEVVTPHGIKGFDTEIAFVVGVDRCFSRDKGVLPNVVYSAMTRARSLLFVTGSLETPQGRPICEAVLQAQQDLEALEYGEGGRSEGSTESGS